MLCNAVVVETGAFVKDVCNVKIVLFPKSSSCHDARVRRMSASLVYFLSVVDSHGYFGAGTVGEQ